MYTPIISHQYTKPLIHEWINSLMITLLLSPNYFIMSPPLYTASLGVKFQHEFWRRQIYKIQHLIFFFSIALSAPIISVLKKKQNVSYGCLLSLLRAISSIFLISIWMIKRASLLQSFEHPVFHTSLEVFSFSHFAQNIPTQFLFILANRSFHNNVISSERISSCFIDPSCIG